MRCRRALLIAAVALVASSSAAAGDVQWNGFAVLRATSRVPAGALTNDEALSGQVQLGLDWRPSPRLLAHVHLLGRTDDGGARRGKAGIPEAYLDANFRPLGSRLRIRAGAFFLPTSRENVDALWASPYAISSSALNTWFGEEFRPIGVDLALARGPLSGGATVYRGNDTFGALPVVRGWQIHDRWTLLGEWVPVDTDYFTSLSAETDHRLGWSARGAWSAGGATLQLTHIDNRSDGEEYGRLYNWGTRFDVGAAEITRGDWTAAAEYGRGPTFLVVRGRRYTDDIDAGYLLLSRKTGIGRVTLRGETFLADRRGYAVTAAWRGRPAARFQPGVEISFSEGKRRVIGEVRIRLR